MIEKMVLFENQKQLEETRDELERCKRFSFRLYAKELPLELTLSHEENNEVNAVKAILKDMEKQSAQDTSSQCNWMCDDVIEVFNSTKYIGFRI